MFEAQNTFRATDIADGLSNTAMMSESILGDGPDNGGAPPPNSAQTVYLYTGFGGTLSDSACAGAGACNVSQRRGFMWASGDMRCAAYNHYYLPNSPNYDCVCNEGFNSPTPLQSDAFQAARSRHTNGVNLLLGDGSVHFVANGVSLPAWRALATRAGQEVISDPGF